MATLTTTVLAGIRQDCAKSVAVDYTKSEINTLLQAVEDWFEANRSSLNSAINTATSPKVFSAAQKKKAIAVWLHYKFGQENT